MRGRKKETIAIRVKKKRKKKNEATKNDKE